jgi:hypothetical protein
MLGHPGSVDRPTCMKYTPIHEGRECVTHLRVARYAGFRSTKPPLEFICEANAIIFPRCSGETISCSFGTCSVCRTRLLWPQSSLLSLLRFPHAVYRIAAGFQFVWPCHSRPYDSAQNRLISAFSLVPYRERMTSSTQLFSEAATLQRKPLSRRMECLDSRKSSWDAAQSSQNC